MSLTKTPFYKVKTLYSITLNPNDAHQGNLKQGAIGRMAQVKTYIWEVLNKFPDIYYRLHVDISEPKKINPSYPRIHFHGVVYFKNEKAILDWQLVVLYKFKSWCNIDIDTVTDSDIWQKYCEKYDHITNITPLMNKIEWKKAMVD